MCGIAGVLAPSGRDVGALVERLTAALAHRGPDGSGFQYARGRSIGLGHRRLSIVDVAGGAQPMSNEDQTVWAVMNGGLSNHGALRADRARRGGVGASVSRQLMSDVPVGWRLSGGVDPTVVTKLMCEGLEQPPAAFAIGFADQRSLDELGAARRGADVLGD